MAKFSRELSSGPPEAFHATVSKECDRKRVRWPCSGSLSCTGILQCAGAGTGASAAALRRQRVAPVRFPGAELGYSLWLQRLPHPSRFVALTALCVCSPRPVAAASSRLPAAAVWASQAHASALRACDLAELSLSPCSIHAWPIMHPDPTQRRVVADALALCGAGAGTQGLAPHHDDVEVFIVQTHGALSTPSVVHRGA